MNKKITLRVIIGNIFLILGFLLNIFIVFLAINANLVFVELFLPNIVHILLTALACFIIGLTSYIIGILILFFESNSLFKINMILLIILHLISSVAFTFYFYNELGLIFF